jgi:V8-like Glu-specific endopeptidase
MKKVALAFLLILVLVLGTATIASAITNGQPDEDDHPYVGLLVFGVETDEGEFVPQWRCSGSLIASNVVLTAGHCTDGATKAQV